MGRTDSAPPGWAGTVEHMKSHPEIDNPFALAHWMANQGMKPHDAMDAAKLKSACDSFKAARAVEDGDDDLLGDGTEYTYGQPRGPEPTHLERILEAEDLEPEPHVVSTEAEVDASAYDEELPGAAATRGHPIYGGAAKSADADHLPQQHQADPDHDGDLHNPEGEDLETEDDELSEIESREAETEAEQEVHVEPQSQAADVVSATGKAHGTSSGRVEQPPVDRDEWPTILAPGPIADPSPPAPREPKRRLGGSPIADPV